MRLATQLAFTSHFASHPRYFAGESVELIHHRVNGVLEFENFALHVDGDFGQKIAPGHSRSDYRDVSDVAGQVSAHRVHGVRQVLPRSCDSRDVSLPSETPLRTYFTSHAGYFANEAVELIHHCVQCFFQLKNFSANIDRNFARQIAIGNGSCHFGDISHLASEVTGHRVDGICQVFPGSGHARHLRLTTELALSTDFSRH